MPAGLAMAINDHDIGVAFVKQRISKGKADRALVEFARRYAAVATEDHEQFTQAIADGRVDARPDRTV